MKNLIELFKSAFRKEDPQTLEEFLAPLITTNKADDMTLLELFGQDENVGGFTFSSEVVKMNEEQHLVYGWAYVCEEGGKEIIDHSGDVIEPDELAKAAHNFIMNYRKAKVMHNGASVGEFVESIVFTKDVQEALNINLNKVGWFVGLKVQDEDVWKSYKSGKLSMFSIGGFGEKLLED